MPTLQKAFNDRLVIYPYRNRWASMHESLQQGPEFCSQEGWKVIWATSVDAKNDFSLVIHAHCRPSAPFIASPATTANERPINKDVLSERGVIMLPAPTPPDHERWWPGRWPEVRYSMLEKWILAMQGRSGHAKDLSVLLRIIHELSDA